MFIILLNKNILIFIKIFQHKLLIIIKNDLLFIILISLFFFLFVLVMGVIYIGWRKSYDTIMNPNGAAPIPEPGMARN